MNAIDIASKNIKSCGYDVGKSIDGKGTEIICPPQYVCGIRDLQDMDEIMRKRTIREIIKSIEEEGVDNVFIEEITISEPDGVNTYSCRHMPEIIQNKFNIKDIIDSGFKGVRSIAVYSNPEVVCTLPLSEFKSDLKSQQDLVCVLLHKIEKIDVLKFFDTLFDEIDGLMKFEHSFFDILNHWRYKGDLTLLHGPSRCFKNSKVKITGVKEFDFQENFKEIFENPFVMCKDPFAKVDPEDRVLIYTREGIDWYVSGGVDYSTIYLTYKNYHGEIVNEEQFWYFASLADDDLVKKVAGSARDLLNKIAKCNNELI